MGDVREIKEHQRRRRDIVKPRTEVLGTDVIGKESSVGAALGTLTANDLFYIV